jgi:hypothetical protein
MRNATVGRAVGLWLGINVGLAGLCAVQGAAQDVPKGIPGKVSAVVKLSKDTVLIAQHFTATVKMRAPRGSTFDIPATIDTINIAAMDTAAPFERFDADSADGYSDVTAIYTLAAWDVGPQRIGLDSIVVHLPGGVDTTIKLDRIDSTVKHLTTGDTVIYKPTVAVFVKRTTPVPSPANMKTLRPKPPKDVLPEAAEIARRRAEQRKTYGTLGLGLALFAVIAYLAYRWYQKRNEPKPVPDPVELEFQRIEAMRLIEQGHPEQHAMLMAEVLRKYLMRHYPAIRESVTTFELHRVLPKVVLVPGDRTLTLLEQIDLLKFAHAAATADEARSMGTESRAIVREVMAREQAAREEAERQAAAQAAQHAKGKGKKAA